MDIQDFKNLLLPTFKAVSLIFAIAAIVTGAQAVFFPIAFSQSFGIPIGACASPSTSPSYNTPNTTNTTTTTNKTHDDDDDDNNKTENKSPSPPLSNAASTYVSLMGIRQLTTGLTLLLFISQQKWTEIATILVVLGVFVAGTDGVLLAREGRGWEAGFHAMPGGGIAGLAGGVLFWGLTG